MLFRYDRNPQSYLSGICRNLTELFGGCSKAMDGRFSCYLWHVCLWQRKWRKLMYPYYLTSKCFRPSSCLNPKLFREWSYGSWPISIGDYALSLPSISSITSPPSSPALPLPGTTFLPGSSPFLPISFSTPPVVISLLSFSLFGFFFSSFLLKNEINYFLGLGLLNTFASRRFLGVFTVRYCSGCRDFRLRQEG